MPGFPHLVIRTGVDVFRPYLNKLESGVPASCIKHVSQLTALNDMHVLSSRPMFSSHYVVYASLAEVDDRYLALLLSWCKLGWVQLIITVSNRIIFDDLKYDKRFAQFTFMDCYRVTNNVIENYIKYVLIRNGCNPKFITKTAVTRIRRRARFKMYVLDSVLPILAKTNLSERVVNSYIAPYTGVTLQNIGARMFEREKSKHVAEFLLRYRYYIDTVFKNVRAYVNTWLELYDEYITGEFSEATMLNWVSQRGEKYKIHYSYEAEKWLRSFRTYSYEFMMIVFLILDEASSENNSLQLSALYKIYRMVNA